MSPASKVAPPRTGQLPIEPTGFVGRQGELATLGALFSRSRLVTVTGPGGVGKTRLALHYAARSEHQYRHGSVLAELSGLHSPRLLYLAVASALGLSRPDARDPLELVCGYLRDREVLLILDTCEHLVDECAIMTEALLREAPNVKILATSRQPLDVPGESTCPLAPLRVPDPGTPPAAGDAVELFAQRAAAALAGFELTDANTPQVIELCRQLEGIPLAIELAAVRLRAFDLAELTRRLERRLPLLTGGRRPSDSRHGALRDTIGWSYDLCTEEERLLWARLSVFAGPFTMQAAEESCGETGLPQNAVVDTLISLIDKSVVVREDGLVPCYRLLDTIREFGAEKLGETGTADQVRMRMAGHFLRLSEEFDAEPLNDQVGRYRALRAQHDNLRASASYAFSIDGQRSAGARLVIASFWYGLISGEFNEARVWTGWVLAEFGEPSVERAGALLLDGILVSAQGSPRDGLAECRDGLAMAEKLAEAGEPGADRIHARGYLYYCLALMMAQLPEQVPEVARVADQRMRAAGDDANAEVLPLYVGLSRFLTRDYEQCRDDAEEALRRLPTQAGERWASSFLHSLSGVASFLLGDTGRSRASARTALLLRQELGDPMGMAFCMDLLGILAADQSDFRQAARFGGIAAMLWKRLGTNPLIGFDGLVSLAKAAAGRSQQALGEDTYTEVTEAAGQQPLAETTAIATGARPDSDSSGSPKAAGNGTKARAKTSGPLTKRENEIAALVAEGLSNRDIASQLVISRRTVDSHVEHIFGKLGVSSRVQLALWIRQRAAS